MFVVVLDTSTPAVTSALVRVGADGVEQVAQRCTVDARAHGEQLAPGIDAVLAEAGVGVRDVGAIVAGLGPGPFTGLRVGLVTAAAMGYTLGIPTYGVCSLDAIGALTSGPVLVATDARRKEIYWAFYVDGKRIGDPDVRRPGPAALLAREHGAETAVGDGALRYAEELGLPVLDEPRYPSAVALAELAADGIRSGAPTQELVPLYLRRPDAMEPGTPKPVSQ